MSAGTAGRVQALEAQVAALAAEIDRLRACFVTISGELLAGAYAAGREEARIESDAYRSAAQAQQRRAALRVLDGGAR